MSFFLVIIAGLILIFLLFYYLEYSLQKGKIMVLKNDNCVSYLKNNVLHREDGPALIRKDRKEWFLNGVRHREDGPAIISEQLTLYSGKKFYYEYWYLNGKKHRIGGPAMIVKYENVTTYDWFLEDKKYSFEEYLEEMSDDDLSNVIINYMPGINYE